MASTSEIQPASSSSSFSPEKDITIGTKGTTSGTKDTTTNTINGVPILVVDGKDRYRVMHPIGRATHGVTVYEATYFPDDYSIFDRGNLNDAFVAIQIVHQTYQEVEHDNLFIEVVRNKACNHHNILKIKKNFNYNDFLCVVMPLDEVKSLRTIMISTPIFNNGLPENCIAVALRETIYGVSRVHKLRQVHKKISAGNIFYHEDSSIKLAYGASIFMRNSNFANEGSSSSDSPQTMGLNCITYWAAPPEVYESGYDVSAYTEESDVWLIGIAALELAYGGVKVVNRGELECLIEGIRVNGRLPNKGEEEDFIFGTVKKKEKKMVQFFKGKMEMIPEIKVPFINLAEILVPLTRKPKEKPFMIKEKGEESEVEKKGIKKVVNFIPKWKGKENEREREKSFSKSFGKMVSGCLAKDPKKRLTLEQLVHHKFFRNSRTVNYFDSVVIKLDENPIW